MSNLQTTTGNLPELKSLIDADHVKAKLRGLVDVKSFTTSLISIVSESDLLKKCDPNTIFACAMKSAALRLPIDKTLGKAYIVPFKGSATFMIGYKGLIELCARSGFYETINATPVYDDEFGGYNYFTGEMMDVANMPINGLRHQKGSVPVGYYAFFKSKTGFKKSIYMTYEACQAHGMKFSKAYNGGPWKTNFDAMAVKTVLRKLLGTYGVLDTDTQVALQNENEQEVVDAETGEIVKTLDPAQNVTPAENPI